MLRLSGRRHQRRLPEEPFLSSCVIVKSRRLPPEASPGRTASRITMLSQNQESGHYYSYSKDNRFCRSCFLLDAVGYPNFAKQDSEEKAVECHPRRGANIIVNLFSNRTVDINPIGIRHGSCLNRPVLYPYSWLHDDARTHARIYRTHGGR